MTEDTATAPNLATLFFDQAERLADEPFLWAKRDGRYRPLSWRETARQVTALARGLAQRGVKDGDRVAILSENRPEWLIADIAIMALGAIAVPAYTTNTEADNLHILENSGAKAAIVSTRRLAERLLPAAHRAADMRFVVTIEPHTVTQRLSVEVTDWKTVLAEGESGPDVAVAARDIEREQTACLIYTSGTGGAPKGVMLSHGAILHNCEGAREALAELGTAREVFLSFLPLSHSYEHTCGLLFPIRIGAEIYYAEGIEHLASNLLEARPTILVGVPRFYELMRSRIQGTARKAGGYREQLFQHALELGGKRLQTPGALSLGERIADRFLDAVARRKVRARFGGRIKAMISGGAPLTPDTGLFFNALGLRLLQGYGQTETAPVVSINRPSAPKMETVGPLLANTEVRIAEDGEILVRGELVMRGYWGDPELTAQTIHNGWLHTGDVGRIDADGHLMITDRKKDIIVNSGGDNISPQRVEGLLTLQAEIAQAMVYGDHRPHLVALLVPDTEWLRDWAARQGKAPDMAALAKDADLHRTLVDVLDRVNKTLSTIERIRRCAVAREPFSLDNEQLTPTMKIRRHAITEAYRDTLEKLYS